METNHVTVADKWILRKMQCLQLSEFVESLITNGFYLVVVQREEVQLRQRIECPSAYVLQLVGVQQEKLKALQTIKRFCWQFCEIIAVENSENRDEFFEWIKSLFSRKRGNQQ